MYVNELALDWGEEGRQAIEELLQRAERSAPSPSPSGSSSSPSYPRCPQVDWGANVASLARVRHAAVTHGSGLGSACDPRRDPVGCPHAHRAGGRRARGRASRRPRGARPAGGSGPRGGRPGRRGRRLLRRCEPGRRGQPQRRAHGGASRRIPGLRRRRHGEPALRVGSLGDRLRVPRRHCRRRGSARRGRRGVDESRAARDGEARQRPDVYDTTLGWRFPNPRLAERFPLESMGETGRTSPSSTASRATIRMPSRCARTAAGPPPTRRAASRTSSSSSPSSTTTSTRVPTRASSSWDGSSPCSARAAP